MAGVIALLAACGGRGDELNSTYTVSGRVIGLNGDLVLQNNAGDDLTLSADGTFRFETVLGAGSSYLVSVHKQPKWQACAVAKGSGSALSNPVVDVSIACTTQARVSTVAGSGVAGSVDGKGIAASFDRPHSLALDNDGSLLLTEAGPGLVRRISPTGDVTLFSSGGTPPARVRFQLPTGLAVNSAGDTYMADSDARYIYKITPSGDVSKFAGDGTFVPRDGLGTAAGFQQPTGLAINAAGDIFIADFAAIRKITAAGLVSTLAGAISTGYVDGPGNAARFDDANGLAIDKAGNLYVADTRNHRIRKVTPDGVVSTLAGSGAKGATDGVGSLASFYSPRGLAVDSDGDVYVADTQNNLVRRITPMGVVSTLAGQPGVPGSLNGSGAEATFRYPYGVAVGADGTVFVADTFNHLIRQLTPVSAP
ncbi:NHL repeat-containing protein [Hydrogenophaga sp.]|uniref:NHL repeat-containing protein n=1 Tax=Hydrogenophaga sp. TaxID=1904254 RepID=UPI00272D6448|nr:NHL repeat-containing protein [Hydrogenophaga sp.]